MRQFLRHFFFPHEANNHRAKALHPDVLLVYIFILALFNFGLRYVHQAYPSVLGYATDIRLSDLLQLTNSERTKLGLPPLQLNTSLSAAAAQKAQDMFAHNYWSHTSPEGKTPWDFIVFSGYEYTMAGENLAKNFSDSGGVVQAWMASQTHRDNIIKPGYQDVGFAIVNGVLDGEETTLVVQMFGTSPYADTLAQKPESLSLGTHTSIPQQAEAFPAIVQQNTYNGLVQSLQSVIKTPRINIPTITRDTVFVFLGLLIGILALDGVVVFKKRIVRVAGNNIAHVMFLVAICIALMFVKRGVLL